MRSLGPFWPGAAQPGETSHGALSAAREEALKNCRRLSCFMARRLLCWLDAPAIKIFTPENFLAPAPTNDDDLAMDRASLAVGNPRDVMLRISQTVISLQQPKFSKPEF